MQENYIAKIQLETLFRPGSMPPSNVTAAIILSLILWPYTDSALLLPWLVAAFAFNVNSNAIKKKFRKQVLDENNIHYWKRVGLTSEFLFGLLWLYACLFFYIPDSLEYELVNFFVVVGVVTAGFARHVIYIPAFYAFSIPVLVAFSIRCFLNVNYMNVGMFALSVLIIISFITFARRINREFVDNMRLRYENMNLIEKLSTQRDLAKQANLAKSKFLAAASHDVRQPLSALLLYYDIVKNRNTSPDLAHHINNMGLSISALNSLFTSLIDISTFDAGVISPNKRHCDVTKIVSRINNDYALQAKEKGLKWTCAVEKVAVYSDSVLIETIIRNLVSNAIRYTEEGYVEIFTKISGENLEIQIKDSGVGIPESKQEKIFEEFYQLGDDSGPKGEGFGLGLSIVQRIVRLLELKLTLFSYTNSGTCFVLSVPLGDMTQVDREKDNVDNAMIDLSGLCVLVVDDDTAILGGICYLLKGWGCSVLTSTSVEGALKKVNNTDRLDCMIIDYDLKGNRNGIDIVKAVEKNCTSTVPTLIITGNTTSAPINVAKNNNYTIFLKPVKPAKIRCFLQHVVAQKKRLISSDTFSPESTASV